MIKKCLYQPVDGIISKKISNIKNVQPYNGLAGIYDTVMDHVDYSAWADYISMIFKKYGSLVCNVVDCGCGTGSLMQKLEKLGYFVAGFDCSFNMVKKAQLKAEGMLWQGNLKSLALKKQWDAVICMYDTIQYLNEDEIKIYIHQIQRILHTGGLFVFDIATKKNIKKYWFDFSNKENINGWEVKRRSCFDEQKEQLYTSFQCTDRSAQITTREHHMQYIYDQKKYKNIVNSDTWRYIGCFHEYTFKPAHHESERVHFVFMKEGL